MSDINHTGKWAARLLPERENPREQVFARKWQEEQGPYRHMLIRLLDRDNVTQEEATAAATVIQWLGSNVGFCFLEECLRECGFDVVRKQT